MIIYITMTSSMISLIITITVNNDDDNDTVHCDISRTVVIFTY